ncbi:MAG: SDR family oxidoreductase [Shewanella sp.]
MANVALGFMPYRETDVTAPLSAYGKSKLAGEQAVFEHLGEEALVIRTAWLFGVDGHNFVNTMLRLMQSQGSLNLIADQWGSPTWSDALAQAIWQLLARRAHGLYHYAAHGQCSWYEFAGEIQRQAMALGLLPAQILLCDFKACELKPCSAQAYAEQALMAGSVLAPRPNYSALCSDKLRTALTPPLAADEAHWDILWQDWRQQLRAMLEQTLKLRLAGGDNEV